MFVEILVGEYFLSMIEPGIPHRFPGLQCLWMRLLPEGELLVGVCVCGDDELETWTKCQDLEDIVDILQVHSNTSDLVQHAIIHQGAPNKIEMKHSVVCWEIEYVQIGMEYHG